MNLATTFCLLLSLASSLPAYCSNVPETRHLVKRVVGGEQASIEEAPFVVQLVRHHISYCTGSLISEGLNWVLTAAHCVLDDVDFIVYGTSVRYTAYLDYHGFPYKKANVSQVIVHPEYNDGVSPYDIALLQLSQPLVPGATVQPVTLETNPAYCTRGATAAIFGFGKTDFPHKPRLMTMQTQLVSNCPTEQDNGRFIIGQVEGKTVCNGDSGGFIGLNGKLIGVTSGKSHQGCEPGDLNFFVNVLDHMDFINYYLSGAKGDTPWHLQNAMPRSLPSVVDSQSVCSMFRQLFFGC